MEESSRVPLIIFDPRSKSAGQKVRCKQLTGNIDFAPTILELAGLDTIEGADGISLLSLLEKPEKEVRSHLALMNTFPPAATTCMSIVTRDLKYTYWWYGDETMKPTEEFYDLKNDPLELKNEADNPQKSAALYQMRKRYDKELGKWKREAVPYNNYQPYGVYFDRTIRIEDKKLPVKKKPKEKRK